jgi:hypothetical protein
MSQLGVGVMLQMLGGNEQSVDAYKQSLGKTISSIELTDNMLIIKFTDETGVSLRDFGQSCCEHRYMVCDDDLPSFAGATLLSAEVANGPEVEGNYEVHEVQFVRIQTSKGAIVVSNHNEHNGYYGGFSVEFNSI